MHAALEFQLLVDVIAGDKKDDFLIAAALRTAAAHRLDLGSAWDEALASDRPVVLEVRTDPNVPPLPPHITVAQAKALMSTLLKGDPDQGSVLVDTAKEVLSGIIPGRKI